MQGDEYFIKLCMSRMLFRTYTPNAVVLDPDQNSRELVLVRSGRIEVKVNNENSKFHIGI